MTHIFYTKTYPFALNKSCFDYGEMFASVYIVMYSTDERYVKT